MKSIFDLEVRTNLIDEYEYLMEYIMKDNYNLSKTGDIYDFLDSEFVNWVYRSSAVSIEGYLERRGLYIKEPESEMEIFWILELFANLIHYYILNNRGAYRDRHELEIVYKSIEAIIEKCNFRILEEDDRIKFIKRDADVDSVLEVVPELKDVLLQYLDFRNEHDIKEKRTLLKYIADYLEPRRDEFKGTEYNNISQTLFFAFNNFNIRHNNDKQISLGDEIEEIYDAIFKLSLHLIRSKMVNQLKNKIDKYK